MKWWLRVANGAASGCRSACNNSPINRARFFPLAQAKRREVSLRSELGNIKLAVKYGQDRQTRQWLCPLLRQWGMGPHQKITPAWAEKLCFTVTATGSYEEAAQVASKWGEAVDDSILHALAQRVGQRAQEQTEQRLEKPPAERQPERPASRLAVLMVDGWMARFRGEGWGKKRTQKTRVDWHEMKTGVFYLQEQSARKEAGRGLIQDKVIVHCQGDAMELGRRLNWEALRGGLGRARQSLFLGDGAPWIWNLKRDRWNHALGLLDFYHGSQHLWNLGRSIQGEKQPALTQWMEPRLHQLRHGEEEKVLDEIAALKSRHGTAGEVIQREKNYFAGHARRMNYQSIARRGWPIGSGAVESACRQKQCRFKRPGQFWTQAGLSHLAALDQARRNHHWEQLWSPN
ncbi:MAG TPA: hypothetical protein VFC44_24735 [Candidatus Saccharimonadales bacterium]|nr:hypothetical protein [Candidatus Saccharimonadales bacterium]